VIPSEAVYTKA